MNSPRKAESSVASRAVLALIAILIVAAWVQTSLVRADAKNPYLAWDPDPRDAPGPPGPIEIRTPGILDAGTTDASNGVRVLPEDPVDAGAFSATSPILPAAVTSLARFVESRATAEVDSMSEDALATRVVRQRRMAVAGGALTSAGALLGSIGLGLRIAGGPSDDGPAARGLVWSGGLLFAAGYGTDVGAGVLAVRDARHGNLLGIQPLELRPARTALAFAVVPGLNLVSPWLTLRSSARLSNSVGGRTRATVSSLHARGAWAPTGPAFVIAGTF